MFQLLDIVRLKSNKKIHGVPPGTVGAIVDIQGNGEAYTVEFVDEEGLTYEDALYTFFTADELEKV